MKTLFTDQKKYIPVEVPTPAQNLKMAEIKAQGFVWDKQQSAAACGVVMVKGDEQWFFGLGGEIMQNPHKS